MRVDRMTWIFTHLLYGFLIPLAELRHLYIVQSMLSHSACRLVASLSSSTGLGSRETCPSDASQTNSGLNCKAEEN